MSSCQTLSPPPHLSASTTFGSTFTLTSLGRRRSPSFLQEGHPELSPPLTCSPSTQLPEVQPTPLITVEPPPTSSMLVVFTSRFLQWIHVQPKHTLSWSTPSSPRSSAEEPILPLSASAQKTSFPDHIHRQLMNPQQLHSRPVHFLLSNAPIIFVILLFPLSTFLVLLCLWTLPISLAWPRTISDVAQLGRELHGYTQSGSAPVAHVVGVMAVTAVWKHAWSVPGSVVWNVLAGALFSPAYATILLTALTMLGSVCATLLSMPLAPFLTHFFPRALDMTRSALEGDSVSTINQQNDSEKPRSPAWVRLSVLRLIGVVPWSGINIACGVCGVSIADCMMGAFIGCLPWTAVTCQIGDILQTVASTPSPTPQTISSLLTSPQLILKLIFLSFLSLAPILGRDHLRQLISPSVSGSLPIRPPRTPNTEVPKWAWVEEWRFRLRLKSPTQVQEQRLKQLAQLVQEKHAFEGLAS